MSKKIMSKEMREKLSGFLPIATTAEFEFTPSIFDGIEDDDYKPVFTCRPLDKGEILTVKLALSEGIDFSTKSKGGIKAKIQKGAKTQTDLESVLKDVIIGWVNLYNFGDGTELHYSKEHISFFPENLQGEILAKVVEVTGFLPKESK